MKKLLAVLLLSSLAFAAKTRDWKDAKLIQVSTGDTGQAVIVPIGTGLYGGRIYRTNYVFETADLVISAVPGSRKVLDLTINKPSKIAIEGQHLYVVDDSGKEKKLNINGKKAK